MHRVPAALLPLIACLLVASAPTRAACAQTWEFSPYRILTWVAIEPSGELPVTLPDEIRRVLVDRAYIVAGATWQLEVDPAPLPLRAAMLRNLEEIEFDSIMDASREAITRDKLFLVTVSPELSTIRIRARELDLATRTFSPVRERTAALGASVPRAIMDAMLHAFAPVTRIEEVMAVQPGTPPLVGMPARIRVRAGGLLLDEPNPSRVALGQVLQPIVRRNNRDGVPLKNGIQVVPFTYLVASYEDGSGLMCQVFTGLRGGLGGKPGSRTERYGLGLRYVAETTDLRLVLDAEPPVPLQGYDLWAKNPTILNGPYEPPPPPPEPPAESSSAAEPSSGDQTPPPDSQPSSTPPAAEIPLPRAVVFDAEKLGRTDWRGSVAVSPTGSPLRIVYVKNGSKLLQRLPIVPGFLASVTTIVPDDDLRLLAEAIVKEKEREILVLAVQQKIIEARLRARMLEGKFDEAAQALEDLRALASPADLENSLLEGQNRLLGDGSQVSESNRRVIQNMFNDTHEVLFNYVSAEIVNKLTQELEATRK